MKVRYFWIGLVFLLVGCSSRVEVFFLNRLVVLDEGLSQVVDREFFPIAALRYRWLTPSQALVYGMDEQQNRGWWLWERGKGRFSPLGRDIQGFDVSGEKILAIGKEWEDGFPLWIGYLKGKEFRCEVSLRFPLVPENSLGVDGGFYLAGKDEEGIHTVFFLSLSGKLEKCLVLTNREAVLRFGRLGEKIVVYTAYEKEAEENLFAFVNEENPSWKVMTREGTVVQKAVFLKEVLGVPVLREGKTLWFVFDSEMRVVSRGPEWKAVVFEELSDAKGKAKGVFLCLLPAEKRSALMVFSWDGVQWGWKTLSP
ncbi:hypothetical protein BREVNS_1362 [Brevinematales bacterium NS]|nr:hypothetical protein BREVNS_1362 [Brevinematales bacterium NS]